MKIVAMVGGLGAQMMQYMFLLSLREQLENEEILMDTSCFDHLKVWNGYELENIFGIQQKDIWQDIRGEYTKLYGNYRDKVLHYCYSNIDKKVCFYYKGKRHYWTRLKEVLYTSHLSTSYMCRFLKRINWYLEYMWGRNSKQADRYPNNYTSRNGITYYDDFSYISDEYLYRNKEVLRNVFTFPAMDTINQTVSREMYACNSVALHVRRSDHMYDNKNLFSRGYFKKAVHYMKTNLEHPVFYIFSEDMEWCRKNLEELGIETSDKYILVDWNVGSTSYRDMQLMTYCKNNILVMSSFSWCGYYLSVHQAKKVVAPIGWWTEVSVHM